MTMIITMPAPNIAEHLHPLTVQQPKLGITSAGAVWTLNTEHVFIWATKSMASPAHKNS